MWVNIITLMIVVGYVWGVHSVLFYYIDHSPLTIEARKTKPLPEPSMYGCATSTTKKKPSLVVKVFIIIVIATVLLWGYGFVKGISGINGGASLISVTYTMKAMNPISRSGYRTYILNFTDVEQRIRSLQSTVSNW